MKLSEFVKQYRTNHNYSLRTFADKCGCSYQYIDKLEKDLIEKPSADMLKKIAMAMGISLQELLSKTDDFSIAINDSKNDPVLPDNFTTPEQAVLWLAGRPVLSFYGGGDISKMDPEDQLEFAKELLSYMKYLSSKKQQE